MTGAPVLQVGDAMVSSKLRCIHDSSHGGVQKVPNNGRKDPEAGMLKALDSVMAGAPATGSQN